MASITSVEAQRQDNFKGVKKTSQTLSSYIYELNWGEHFPLELESGYSISHGNFHEASEFYSKNYKDIYQVSDKNEFLATSKSTARERYYQKTGDFFFFKYEKKIVGIFSGTPIDWATYYFRNCSIIKEHQGKGLYQKLLIHLIQILKNHGLERIEGDVGPHNPGHIHILNKIGFKVTGFNLSERWGALTKLTLFLKEQNEEVFMGHFCNGSYQQNKVV